MRLCKYCKQWKDESQFYVKGHYVAGKYYASYSGRCKKCECEIARLRRMNGLIVKRKDNKKMYQSRDIENFVISDTQYVRTKHQKNIERDVVDPEAWVIRNLKLYGNCFVGKRHDFGRLEKIFGKLRYIVKENGFILEVAN